MAAIIARACDV